MLAIHRLPATVLIVIAIVCVQAGAALAKSLFEHFGPVGTVYLRIFFAALVLLMVVRPSLSLLKQGRWRIVAIFGAVLAAMNVFYYLALERLPLGLTVTVEFFGPLGVALWQSRKLLDLLWVALAAAGILLLNPFSGSLDTIGLIYAVIAGGSWAAYIVLGQKMGGDLPGSAGLTFSMLFAMMLLTPVVGGEVVASIQLGWGVLAAVGVAVLSSVIPYSFEIEALRRMSTQQFGILMSMEPAVASVIGWFLLSENLSTQQWLAVFLVMFASYGVVRFGRTPAKEMT